MLLLASFLIAAPVTYAVEKAPSTLRYHIIHKLHKVSAESRAVEGKAVLSDEGTLKLMARAQVASFDSGDKNRDQHMLEVVDAGKFPSVTVKAMAQLERPKTFPATIELPVVAEIEFHGEKHEERFPLKVEFTAADNAKVKGSFSISLEKYKVERPSLLFVKIDDGCIIDVDLSVTSAK